ncbi:ABC transporter ATP-binding protein [Clostridium mediterraneense]|uniref:ABC transporter ATP-binding protein n=1 Tax=Clostridium mediterraneense TaxID=1805472 RepID=UPI00082C023F|nr:ABC transporter ATP-binding protein [Clostridium mediterraneense]
MEILKVSNIQKTYGSKENKTKALNGISLSVEEGEFVGIMGPSGSGKTTLLNCIATIDNPTSGDIIINGKNIVGMKGRALESFRRDELGFVFQDFNLLDTLTAYENIALALTIQGRKHSEIDGLVVEAAKKLGIEKVLNKYPYEMSGGQKQRVASARAIVTHPSIMLADEPTGALDSKSSGMLLESFEKLNQELKTTILMVTHDAFTASYARRIFFIKDGQIYKEIVKGNKSRKEFFNEIMEVVTLLGGNSDVL